MSWIYWLPIFATALSWYNCWVPGGSLFNIVGYLLWFILVVVGIMAAVIDAATFNPGEEWLTAFRRPVWPNIILFFLTVLSVSPCLDDLAFQVSRDELEAFAQEVKRERPTHKCEFQILKVHTRKIAGVVPIIDYAVKEDGGVYLITSQDFLRRSGFAYKPSRKWLSLGRFIYSFEHLSKDWYIAREALWL